MKAVFPGSFHPPTKGHIDIIRRAAKMFDELYVAILVNADKKYLIDAETRGHMLEKCLCDLANVKVVCDGGLTSELAKRLDAEVLVRGVRDAQDFEYEIRLADVNRALTGVDTVLLPAKPEISSISSSIVRDIALHGGDIGAFVPEIIKDDILTAIKKGV